MWPFRKRVRYADLLKKHFGEGLDGPVLIASGEEFVRSYPWVRFTCRGLDYAVERERNGYGSTVQVGRADRPGRPTDPSAFGRLSLEGIQNYNKDMFYWDFIEAELGTLPDVRHMELDALLAALSRMEPQLQSLFADRAYVGLQAERAKRVEAVSADLAR